MAVPENVVDRDSLIELIRAGNSPEKVAQMFRVDVSIVKDMIKRLQENGYYDLFRS